jgi:murein DD-endopeptidase MepM/ murein hydrolase activator NlpD
MYEMGETTYLDVLLSSSSLSDFLSRYYLLSEISEADYRLVSEVKKYKDQTENITKALAENKETLEADKVEKEKYEISLANMEILKNSKLSELSEEEVSLYNEIEEYRNQITTVEYEIKELALKNLGKTYIGGSMIWPAPGYTTITSEFGMRTHPISGIYKLHTGVDIGAPYGANFVAANDGIVIKADENVAYGKMVMIDHGGGVVSLYAHGSEICVEVGDKVNQGQTVLKVGSSGYSTGPHAHFEIRINGEYLNPLDYISPNNNQSDSEIEEIVVNLDE